MWTDLGPTEPEAPPYVWHPQVLSSWTAFTGHLIHHEKDPPVQPRDKIQRARATAQLLSYGNHNQAPPHTGNQPRAVVPPIPPSVVLRQPKAEFEKNHVELIRSDVSKGIVKGIEWSLQSTGALYNHSCYAANEALNEFSELRSQLLLLISSLAHAETPTNAAAILELALGSLKHIEPPPHAHQTPATDDENGVRFGAQFNRIRDLVSPTGPPTDVDIRSGPQSLRSLRLLTAELADARVRIFAKAKTIIITPTIITPSNAQPALPLSPISAEDWVAAKQAIDQQSVIAAAQKRAAPPPVKPKPSPRPTNKRKRTGNQRGRGATSGKRTTPPPKPQPDADPPKAADGTAEKSKPAYSPQPKKKPWSAPKKT